MFFSIETNLRLAQIRMEIEKWEAQTPESKNWDASFLLRIIDTQNQKIAELKKELERVWRS